MKIIEEGHIYKLTELDCISTAIQTLCFVNRGNGNDHAGTNNQEVLRVLINRIEFLDKQLPWDGNEKIIEHLRQALVLHESRHLERLVERGELKPEEVPVGSDGHFIFHKRRKSQ
jgi:hypothetical protein